MAVSSRMIRGFPIRIFKTLRAHPTAHAAPALILLLFLARGLAAQTTTTIRHHRVSEENPSFPPELVQAETAIEKRDYAAAQPLLEKVVAKNPTNYQAWFDLGFVFHALGKMDESIDAYRKSVAAKPDVFESNLNLGLSLALKHDPGAEQFLRAATGLTPTSRVEEGQARAWLSLAHLLETSKPEQAIEAYRKAEALQPKDPEPHLASGSLLEKQNRLADAEQEYKTALMLDSSSSDAMTGMANVYMRERQFPDAEGILRKLAAVHPNDGVIRIQLGRVLAAEGKKDDAIAELQAGLKLAPEDIDAQHDLADLYGDTKKYDSAADLYRSILARKPNDAELHDSLGKMLLRQHKFTEAQQEFMAAVRLRPDFGAAYGDLAVAANENKNYELAIKAADARAKFLPEIPISYFLRATAYDHLRDNKNAALNYHQFLNVANGQFPDQEWQARHRLIAIEPKK